MEESQQELGLTVLEILAIRAVIAHAMEKRPALFEIMKEDVLSVDEKLYELLKNRELK